MKKEGCIFCSIAAREAPSHVIAEDAKHLAFLSIFPNTEGFSVVITKDHCDSYFADCNDEDVAGLVLFSKQVAKKLDRAFDDVGRTGLFFEGFGVDHLHTKLAPLHGTKSAEWRERKSLPHEYFTQYKGYISSHDYEREDDAKLSALADKIRAA